MNDTRVTVDRDKNHGDSCSLVHKWVLYIQNCKFSQHCREVVFIHVERQGGSGPGVLVLCPEPTRSQAPGAELINTPLFPLQLWFSAFHMEAP